LTIDIRLDSIRCPFCGLIQLCTFSTNCRRCRRSLGIRYATLTISPKILEKENSSEELTLAFGRMMRGIRLGRGMTQADCAILLQTSRSHVSRLESGRLSPSFSMLFRAARAFSVDRVILRIRVPKTPTS
jgi:DNA-binding XRE family transcriptional regulator